MAESLFPSEVEIVHLFRLQQADDDVDPFFSPSEDLVLQPVPGPRPRHDREPTRATALDPVSLRAHLSSRASAEPGSDARLNNSHREKEQASATPLKPI